jgi:hypothetical protein
MDIIEKFIRNNGWRFEKGYPDINNPKDNKLLYELIEKVLTYENPKKPNK